MTHLKPHIIRQVRTRGTRLQKVGSGEYNNGSITSRRITRIRPLHRMQAVLMYGTISFSVFLLGTDWWQAKFWEYILILFCTIVSRFSKSG